MYSKEAHEPGHVRGLLRKSMFSEGHLFREYNCTNNAVTQCLHEQSQEKGKQDIGIEMKQDRVFL